MSVESELIAATQMGRFEALLTEMGVGFARDHFGVVHIGPGVSKVTGIEGVEAQFAFTYGKLAYVYMTDGMR